MDKNTPILWGGLGKKKSNNQTQWYQQDRIYDGGTIAMALCRCMPHGSYYYAMKGRDMKELSIEDIRIRKLTPRECWRLMAFDDEDFDKASKVNSNSQLYKQAGNSIVVSCLEAIFGQMIEGKENEWKERWAKK